MDGEHFVHPSWLELQAFWTLSLQSPLANVQIRGAVTHSLHRLSLLVLGGVERMEKGGLGIFTPF